MEEPLQVLDLTFKNIHSEKIKRSDSSTKAFYEHFMIKYSFMVLAKKKKALKIP